MSRRDIGALLAGLSSPEAQVAWRDFLEDYSGHIYHVVRIFERDEDHAADCFLFVCEALRRDGFRRLRSFRPGGPATFETWLHAVVRNLSIDWRRQAFGRFRLLRAIDQRPALEQEVFRCSNHLGLTAEQILRTLRPDYPSLTLSEVDDILVRLHGSLSSRERWLLASRSPIVESLEAGPATSDDRSERPLPHPGPSPENRAADTEIRERLRDALQRLTSRSRLALRLRFEQELSLKEVARLMRLEGGPQAAARQIDRSVKELRELMEGGGHDSSST